MCRLYVEGGVRSEGRKILVLGSMNTGRGSVAVSIVFMEVGMSLCIEASERHEENDNKG